MTLTNCKTLFKHKFNLYLHEDFNLRRKQHKDFNFEWQKTLYVSVGKYTQNQDNPVQDNTHYYHHNNAKIKLDQVQ